MTEASLAERDHPNPSPFVALAFLTPWALVAFFLPDPWRVTSLALVAILAMLLLGAASWSHRHATQRGLDAPHWAFVTVLTLGVGMLVLAFGTHETEPGARMYVCTECGHRGDVVEAFCYRCGAA